MKFSKLISFLVICVVSSYICAGGFDTAYTKFPKPIMVAGVPIHGGGDKLFTTGSIFFVDSVNGTDTNSGENADEPLATIRKALTLTTTTQLDIIAVMPGHIEYIPDSPLAFNNANVIVKGLGQSPLCHIITSSCSDTSYFDINANYVVIENLMILISSGPASDQQIFDVDANGVVIKDVYFDFRQVANMEGINFGSGYKDCVVKDSYFVGISSMESCIVNSSSRTFIIGNQFDFSVSEGYALEQPSDNTGNALVIADNIFQCSGVATILFKWNASPGAGHAIFRNKVFDNLATGSVLGGDTDLDYMFIENYNGAANGANTVFDPSP